MEESKVEFYIKRYLKTKGWRLKQEQNKKKGERGVDIQVWHPQWRKILLVEAKGGSGKHKNQEKHNAFYTLLGQILSRMNKEGNNPNKAKIYAIGIPYDWDRVFKKKIKKMEYGWRLLKLKTFLVQEDGNVLEKPYLCFLK